MKDIEIPCFYELKNYFYFILVVATAQGTLVGIIVGAKIHHL